METIIYVIRHSETFENYGKTEYEPLNQSIILSENGENKAKQLSQKLLEKENIDIVYSSDYARAMSTAKYFCSKDTKGVYVDSRFGERKIGIEYKFISSKEYYKLQFTDLEYKFPKGECAREVKERFTAGINEILQKNIGKKIILITHGAAMGFYFQSVCEDYRINEINKCRTISFNRKIIFDGIIQRPDIFKLTFENQKLKDLIYVEQ